MSKYELEVKVLNIDKDEFIKKLESLGAIFKGEYDQVLYTYDLPTIYGRYIDLVALINNPESKIKLETTLSRLRLLFFEIDNLLVDKDKEKLLEIIGTDTLSSLLEKDDVKDYLNNRKLINFIKKFHNNSKKWIRLRQTNDITTLAVKHILADNGSNLQQMLETEIIVPSIKEANSLLEALGISYKSYQEKKRITYIYDGYEIDIDTWPGIPTYFEIEGKSEDDLERVLSKLGYTLDDTVSCTADDIYRMNGLSMFYKRELLFEQETMVEDSD